MGQHEEPVLLYGGFVFEHTILRYSQAVERRSESAQSAHDYGVLDAGRGHRGEVAEYHEVADEWYCHEQPSEEEASETAPERAA